MACMTLSNSLTHKESSLAEIVGDIKKGHFAIPSFQRGVVWKTPDVRKLGDSLLWGYPVSSLLLMPVSEMFDVKHSLLAVEGLPAMNKDHGSFVLDGQQRLTAIAKLFVESASNHVYYYDLLYILAEGHEHNSRQPDFQPGGVFEKGLVETIQPFKDLELMPDHACKAFKRSKATEGHESMRDHRFIRCDVVLNSGYGKYINKFLDAYIPAQLFKTEKLREKTKDLFMDYLTALFGSLRGYGIPITLINDSGDLNLVCSVFERVNSSGIKLTTFDLVNAKSYGYKKHEGGFASYVSFELNNDPQITAKRKASLNRFFEFSKSGYSDLARLLRILYNSARISSNSGAVHITNGLLLEKPKEFWFDEFDKKKQTLYDVVDWAERSGLTSLASKTFVESIVAIFLGVEKSFTLPAFKSAVIKYGLSLSVHGHAFNASSYKAMNEFVKYAKDLLQVTEWERMTLQSPHYLNSSAITADNILSTRYSGKGFRYSAMLAVMYDTKHKGLFGHDLCGETIDYSVRYDPENPKHKFEDHHLIPKSSTASGSVPAIDSIANIVLLTRDKNGLIGNQSPRDYFDKLAKQPNFDRLREENLIDKDTFDLLLNEQYSDFLLARATALAGYINDYFQFDKERTEDLADNTDDE